MHDSITDLETLKKRITPGMTRSQVESILSTRDGGLQEFSRTRYVAAPRMIVEVCYDGTGGPWSPDNRVMEDLRVFGESIHLD